MMSEQQQRIMGYFIEEAKDHLNTIEQGLLSLQSTIEDPEMVSEVFRAAHSVKGGAAMLGLNSIQMVSHRLEDFFKVLKECPVRVDQKLETLFLSVLDALKELLDQLQGPFGLTDDKASEVMREAEPVFNALGEHLSFLVSQSGGTVPEEVQLSPLHASPVAAPAVAAAPAKPQPQEVSALHLIFQSDVPARLRDMLQLFKQPETNSTRQQLQAICENLAQAGEQFDLPEWGDLTDLARQAIASLDNTYRALAPVIIKNIKQAQELVLAGRAAEITASDSLKALVPAEPELSDSLDFADAFADLGLDSDDESAELFDFDLEPGRADFLEPTSATFAPLHDPLQATFIDDSTFVQPELSSNDFALRSDQADSTVINLPESLSTAPVDAIADHNGPEVGIAELNSLADLFEGEVPDLGMTWQEEEVLGSADSARMSFEESNDADDFSDLLFDQDGLDDLALDADSDEDDLSGLLGRSSSQPDLLEPLSMHELPDLEPLPEPSASDAPITSLDLLDLDATPTFESDELGNLFADSSEISRDFEDAFGAEPVIDDSTFTESFVDENLTELDLAALEFAETDFPEVSVTDAEVDDFTGLDELTEPSQAASVENSAASLELLEEMVDDDDALLENLFSDNLPESITTSEDWLEEEEESSAPEVASEPMSDPWGTLEDDITDGGSVGAIAPSSIDLDLSADLWDEGVSTNSAQSAIDSLDDSAADDPFASLDLSDDLTDEVAELGDFASLDDSLGADSLGADSLDADSLSVIEPDPFAELAADVNPFAELTDTDDFSPAVSNMPIEAIADADVSMDSELPDLFGNDDSELTEEFGELEFNFGDDFAAADAGLDSLASDGDGDGDLNRLEENVASLDDLELGLILDDASVDESEGSLDFELETPSESSELLESSEWEESIPELNIDVGQTLTESLLELELSAVESAAEDDASLGFENDFESLSFADEFSLVTPDDPSGTSEFSESLTDSSLESLDFGDFSLTETTEEAAFPDFSEGATESSLESLDLGDLSLQETTEETPTLDFSEGATDSGLETLDFDDFSLTETDEAVASPEFSESLTDSGFESLDFGDLSLEDNAEEPLSLDFSEDVTDGGLEALDFGDFSLEENTEELSTSDFSESLTDSGLESLDFDNFSLEEPSQTAASLDFSESVEDSSLESLDFGDFSLDESSQEASADVGDLDFGDLNLLVEQSDSGSSLDFDALSVAADESSNSSTDPFNSFDLDGLLDDADHPVTDAGLDDLSELDALLGDADPQPTDAIASGFADDSDSFADLDALLGDSDSSSELGFPDADSEHDDFADLDALLGDDEPMANASSPISSSTAGGDSLVIDEFGDLEKLLENADQTLGGAPTVRGVRGSSAANPRRRAGGVLTDQTMRVSVKNLDNLNNLVGELVVNRNSLEQAEERLRQFLDNLLYQVQQLSDVGQRMRDLYERSLLESSLLSNRRSYQMSAPSSHSNDAQSNHATGASFDALEMDRFTGFHTLSQEMIELIVRVRESASDIDFVVEETDQITRNFRQITTQLQEGLTRSRMVPFAQTADRLPRAVRDISIKCGKQAELVIEGRETLIDKMILEQLYDPMTHLVNNAITHGIETADERMASGKDPTGKITVRTFHQGNQTVISVTDDGAGINPEVVKRKAVEKGLITQAQALEMSRLDIYDLLFHHGFSTRDKADDFAGRGVGMDVVRTSLNEIRGVVNIDSQIGRGTTFTIRLPLTLSISKALCCISNRARIAFPMDGVEDMLDVPRERVVRDDQDRSCIQWRDSLLPFQPLSDLLRHNRSLGRGSVYGGNQEEDIISVVVLRSAGNYIALQVDQVLGEQEIVIKQLEGPVPKPIGVAGATVLGDGRIMPIADVLELIDLSMGRIRRDVGSSLWEKDDVPPPVDPADNKTEPTVLIVDDSITVRELLSMTFQKVGYRVEQARDGQEAWEKLRSGLPCDLVFCDIEMPRMDGLELLSRLQKDTTLNHLPIAMLTSRGADRHRQMAVQLGAKGYFTKPYLEEALLDAAQRMLKGEVLVAGNS